MSINVEGLLEAKEGAHYQFKEAKQRFDSDEAVRCCCALSNCGGGMLVFGISDKRPRKVVGSLALVERSGQGMNIIYEESIKEAKQLPDFTGTDDSFVVITLNGIVLDAKMLAMINKIGNDRLESLSTGDFLVINALYHDNAIPQNLHSRLKKLNDLGIVEHIGRNKFILSRNLYSVAGKSGVHTRKRGLDRETNKELIVKHIISCGDKGAKFSELQQVLPNLNRNQIQDLMRELRAEKRIYYTGKTNSARWFIVSR